MKLPVWRIHVNPRTPIGVYHTSALKEFGQDRSNAPILPLRQRAIRTKDEEGFYSEDEDVLRPNFVRFSRGKRYVLESWNAPKPAPLESSSPPYFILYVFIPLFVIVFFCIFVSVCIQILKGCNCSSVKSDSQSPISADISITVRRPPTRTTNVFEQMHMSPTGRNQFLDSRICEPRRTDLFRLSLIAIELGSIHVTSDNTGVSSMHPNYATSSQGITETFLDSRIGETPRTHIFRPWWKTSEVDRNHATSDNTRHSSMCPNYASSSQGITENLRGSRIGELPWKAIELDKNHAASANTEVSSMYHNYISSSRGVIETSNTVEDQPPDYSTVILNDLINST
ncbi:hypothetical protein AVEN_44783-1 [Araneus ventricosus]|uniref:Uncharacterized protein n=1 Tax=Araneus ventricosus TaxID=182803 RepID=A0A4Y2TWH6_ARAVE|nr:hypothetical protein AVEN_44783-1 [Araneus ventricosus]